MVTTISRWVAICPEALVEKTELLQEVIAWQQSARTGVSQGDWLCSTSCQAEAEW